MRHKYKRSLGWSRPLQGVQKISRMCKQVVLVRRLPSSCHYCIVSPCQDADVWSIMRKEVLRPEHFARGTARCMHRVLVDCEATERGRQARVLAERLLVALPEAKAQSRLWLIASGRWRFRARRTVQSLRPCLPRVVLKSVNEDNAV